MRREQRNPRSANRVRLTTAVELCEEGCEVNRFRGSRMFLVAAEKKYKIHTLLTAPEYFVCTRDGTRLQGYHTLLNSEVFDMVIRNTNTVIGKTPGIIVAA